MYPIMCSGDVTAWTPHFHCDDLKVGDGVFGQVRNIMKYVGRQIERRRHDAVASANACV